MNLRCYLLSLLRMHQLDCVGCKDREMYGKAMQKRLEELNWRTQPPPTTYDDYGVEVGDDRATEVISQPISLKARQGKKTA